MTALPNTPQQVVDFIGSNFDAHQFAGPDGTPIPIEDQRFTLSVHDLLSAFWQWEEFHWPTEAGGVKDGHPEHPLLEASEGNHNAPSK